MCYVNKEAKRRNIQYSSLMTHPYFQTLVQEVKVTRAVVGVRGHLQGQWRSQGHPHQPGMGENSASRSFYGNIQTWPLVRGLMTMQADTLLWLILRYVCFVYTNFALHLSVISQYISPSILKFVLLITAECLDLLVSTCRSIPYFFHS